MKKILLFIVLAVFCGPFAAAQPDYPAEVREKNVKRHELFQTFAASMGDGSGSESEEGEAGRLSRNLERYERKFCALSATNPICMGFRPLNTAGAAPRSRRELESIRDFLQSNTSDTSMPLSFKASPEYWRSLNEQLDPVDAVIERTLVEHALNIYDGALWQIALTLVPSNKSGGLVDLHTDRLLGGEAGDIRDLRGYGPAFLYGDEEKIMDRSGGFFFRMITDRYLQDDPLGQNEVPGFPNFSRVHHEDWKPVTGEQAWAAIIGPLQVAYEKYGGKIPAEAPEMKLAMSVLPALEAMQSPIGAFYHAPKGTFGIHPKLISVENNLSVYAALKMLEAVLRENDPPAAADVKSMISRLDDFFEKYAYDPEAHEFAVGGFYVEGQFVAQKLLATDCQTWAVAALGPEWIDERFGAGESYWILKTVISHSRRIDSKGTLQGIGFTSDHAVLSVEWTCGAILAARRAADFYALSDPEKAQDLLEDAARMREGVELYKTELPGGKAAYLYVSERYFIPFGWWANPIPSVSSSAWVLFIDLSYDPFQLGGGTKYNRMNGV